MSGNPVVIGITLVYCVGVILLGIFLSGRVKTSEDFWLAGRTLGPWVCGVSYVATYYSSVAMVGSVGYIYTQGIGYGTWLAIGCSWLFALGAFVLVALPIRSMSGRLNAITLPELYGYRFGSDMVKVVASMIIVIFYVPWVTSILKAIGNVLEVVAGIPYVTGVILTTVVVLIYLWSSGYFGVCWSDFIQGWIMLAGVCILAPVALYRAGGMTGMVSKLRAIDPNLVAIPGNHTWGMFLSLALVWGLVCWGSPSLLARFQGIRSEKDIGRMCLVATVFATLIIGLNYALGPIARALYGNEFMKNPDITVPTLIMRQLPTLVAGLYVGAIAAAAMSSLDSAVLVAASAVGRDIYEGVLAKRKGKEVSQRTLLVISRVVSLVVILAGAAWAINPPGIVFVISLYCSAVLGASLGPSLFYTLFWRRANWQGCVASMIIGVVVTLLGYRLGLKAVHPYVPGTVAAALAFPVVSLLTPPPAESLVKKAFGR